VSCKERHLEVSEAFQVELELTYVLLQSQPNSVRRADLHVHDYVPAIRLDISMVVVYAGE
jgi:hypothetical protein